MFNLFQPKVRTRFAPSPTGYLHLGGLRTALYAYLFACQNKGGFLLRLEDTDQTREIEGAVDNLLKSLKWAGLEPDEGILLNSAGKVAEKGKFGPYKQSARAKIYQKYAQELVNTGQAYYCFCSSERLEELRQNQQKAGQPTRYDKLCANLSQNEVKNKLEAGNERVIRMKISAAREVAFNDLIRGGVKFNTADIDDQIILKSDGFPTYHLASVVDDHLMQISHVFRGEEWLSSTPKHILLYEYFGWDIPQFAHLSLLLNPDKSKMSKRQGDVSVEDFRDQGYLPEALINFIALLGWNPGTEREIFSLDDLVKVFDLKKVHKAGAVFDQNKLDWMNGEYIKEMDFARFKKMALPFLKFPPMPEGGAGRGGSGININKLLEIEKERISKLSETGERLGFVFADINYDAEKLIWKKSDKKSTVNNLKLLIAEIEGYEKWTAEYLQDKIAKFIVDNKLANGEVLWPMRFALTGQEKSPTPFEVAEILGKAKSMERLREAVGELER